jgi:hypothetical protein
MTSPILAKAFCGELVPTEAEFARQQGRPYEPANHWLDRLVACAVAASICGVKVPGEGIRRRHSRSSARLWSGSLCCPWAYPTGP